jgi:hypothetical protein
VIFSRGIQLLQLRRWYAFATITGSVFTVSARGKYMKFHHTGVLSFITATVFIAGCGSDSTSPDRSALAGSYAAILWTTTGTSGQTSQLAIGSTLQINLNADGSTSGHMHIAASNSNPAADFDLAGAWRQSGTTVDFTQVMDNLLSDMTFTLDQIGTAAWDLVGDDTFNGTRVQITLRRGP